MIRTILLLLSAVVAIALGYFIGPWVLFGLLAAMLAILLFSTRREPRPGENTRDSDFHSTIRADP